MEMGGNVADVGPEESYSIVVGKVDESSTEVQHFHIPGHCIFKNSLKAESNDTVGFRNIQFRSLSASVLSASQLLHWDFVLGQASATVIIYHRAELDFLMATCQLLFLAGGNVEREGCVISSKSGLEPNESNGLKRIQFNFYLEGYYEESTDKISVILTFPPRMQLIQPSHSQECEEYTMNKEPHLYSFQSFFMSENFSDIWLSSGSQQWPAHKIVLAGSSEVFKRMLQSGMKESQEGHIKLDDYEPEGVKAMLQFVYTGDFDSNPNLILDLFKLAHAHEIKGLVRKVYQLIVASITVENAQEIFTLGDVYDLKPLMKKAFLIAKRDKQGFAKTPEHCKILTDAYPNFMFKLLTDD